MYRSDKMTHFDSKVSHFVTKKSPFIHGLRPQLFTSAAAVAVVTW